MTKPARANAATKAGEKVGEKVADQGGTKGDEPATPERLYGGLTADERRAERRRRLIDTALELFGTEGYPVTGIERICSHAGVTARHFYDEFGSRETLLRALFDEIVQYAIEQVAAAVREAPLDTIASVRVGIDAFLHAMLDDPRRARIQCTEIVGVSAEFEAHRRAVLHLWAEVVADQGRGLGVGPRSDDRARLAGAVALVGGTNELLTEYLTEKLLARPTLDVLANDLVLLFVAVSRVDDQFAADVLNSN